MADKKAGTTGSVTVTSRVQFSTTRRDEAAITRGIHETAREIVRSVSKATSGSKKTVSR